MLSEITQDETYTIVQEVVVMGDLNGSVGISETDGYHPVDKYRKVAKNSNQHRIIEFCITNNINVCYSYVEHKDIIRE